MNNKQLDKNESVFNRRIQELKNRCQQNDVCVLTSFLSLNEQDQVYKMIGSKLEIKTNGYFENAERKKLMLIPKNNTTDVLSYKLEVIIAKYCPDYININHRDVLGALLGLGIKRELVGDIFLNDEIIAIVVDEKISAFIILELVQINRLKVSFEHTNEPILKELKFVYEEYTISSFRIDSVVAAITHLSRTKAQDLISDGLIRLNDTERLKNELLVKEDDRLSIRGYGKFLIGNTKNVTKKQNYIIAIGKYI